MLEHGGRLNAAARRFGIAREQWLDLSTGIAPWPYPLPAVPAEVWQRLPEEDDGLDAAVQAHFGAPGLIVPGSQWAIGTVPRLLPPGRVAMPTPIYAEHLAAWRGAGHRIVGWDEAADYAVLCQPNNPTGQRWTHAELLERAKTLRLFVCDEAFLDMTPEETLIDAADNVLVLRSLGKFFGLAGLRIGFVFASKEWLTRLRERLDPWAVSHPARWAARLALADRCWQQEQRQRLIASSARLARLLCAHGLENAGAALFCYVPTQRAEAIYTQLARRGILVRRFDAPPALRFGLPANEAQWQRLEQALISCTD
ncbi:threonine-phosphate decarboxylase CobD [Sulfuricystis multivorans]|uniref:threonine-phosphate decarboxylase CobD n=1 Tax=Sulfuricystis multivorans TaxID=2211108 RepID=UPI000F842116|nr:threonine-phosphate decarboxylase CobD [Sulfuricystis multivorans]